MKERVKEIQKKKKKARTSKEKTEGAEAGRKQGIHRDESTNANKEKVRMEKTHTYTILAQVV